MGNLVLFFLFGLILCSNLWLKVQACGYVTCPQIYDHSKLHLHIISHSHDDVGWLATADGYAHNDVSPLLSAVVQSLELNKQRKFVEVEMYYFKRWWQRQNSSVHEAVKKLVASGQFTFAGGGWCMNDEATTHYSEIIDQMTLGIEFIREQFGECAVPKLSWQIDPFGASREVANLFALMGFDAHVTNRGNSHLKGEFIWNTSAGHSIFTSRMHHHYHAPDGFNFEDSDHITEENKHAKAKTLVDLGKSWNVDYGSKGHVLLTFGHDFSYKHAERWFSNLDKLIEVVNHDHPDVHLHYSSPHCYMKAVREVKAVKLETKSEDYFPYWTGYFSSRPVVKYLDRFANNLLQAAKQLEVLAELGNTQALIWEGKNELGILQHHDAITGTSPPAVMTDYKQRLVNAIKSVQSVISQALNKLTRKSSTSKTAHKPYIYTTVNISELDPHLTNHQAFAVILYNPLVQPQTNHWVRIPVSDQNGFQVFDSNGTEIRQVSFVPISGKIHSMVGHHKELTFEVVFPTNIKALGFSTYFVAKVSNGTKLHENSHALEVDSNKDLVLHGKSIQLVVDHQNGKLKSLIKNSKKHHFVQSFAYYPAKHSSNTYQFCPTGGAIDLTTNSAKVVHSAKYAGFSEVTQYVNDWISQTIRVYEDKDYVELDWVVGPIPDDSNGIGKEVITRFETELKSNGTFYTDANGRQMIERRRNGEIRECSGTHNAISYNYYPVTSRASIRDHELELNVIPDRSVGASSLHDGQLELMIHRRMFESLGNGINMNDLDSDGNGIVARGRIYLFLSSNQEAADNARQLSRQVSMQPIIAVNPIENIATYKTEHNLHFSAVKSPVPENVHLLTLENHGSIHKNEILVRLENFYQSEDASKLNTPSHVQLDAVLGDHLKIEQIEKTNLIAGHPEVVKSSDLTLAPQDLATFVVKVKRNASNSVCGLKWSKLSATKQLPEHSIVGGHEATNASLYICRHKHVDGDLIPGKFGASIHCHISYGGKELTYNDDQVEILTSDNGSDGYQWAPRHHGDPFPEQSFVGGHNDRGLPLYIGRCATEKHGLVVGKIDEYFYYSYGQAEHKDCVDYEILTC